MSVTKQAEGERPIPVGRDPQVDATRTQLYGNQLQKGLLAASATGLGVGGLYYLSKYLADKYRSATRLPDPQELANTPISEVTAPEDDEEPILPEMATLQMPSLSKALKPSAPQKKVAGFDPTFLYAPAIGAGAGALIGAARSGKGRRRQNAILGATIGGLGGLGTAAATSKPLWQYVAKNLPKNELFPGLSKNPDTYIPAETPQQEAWRAVVNTTLPAVGAAGGLALADTVARRDSTEQNLRGIEDARREYFTALTGRQREPAKEKDEDIVKNPEEKKSSVNNALDKLYAAYVAGRFEKSSETPPATSTPPGITGTNTFYNYFTNLAPKSNRSWPEFGSDLFGGISNTDHDLRSLMYKLMLGGGLGAGAIGAKYMYDQTKAKSEARNLQRAANARRRMQGLDSPWVDPKELAEVKRMAGADNPAYARGV